jgi:hypothetical protein
MSEKAGMPGCHSRFARMASLKGNLLSEKAGMLKHLMFLFFKSQPEASFILRFKKQKHPRAKARGWPFLIRVEDRVRTGGLQIHNLAL